MFWIFKNKTPTKDELNDRESFTALHEGDNRLLPDMTNYSGELRVWLPTTVSVALGDMSDETNLHTIYMVHTILYECRRSLQVCFIKWKNTLQI
jgi:hypothetical protein